MEIELKSVCGDKNRTPIRRCCRQRQNYYQDQAKMWHGRVRVFYVKQAGCEHEHYIGGSARAKGSDYALQ